MHAGELCAALCLRLGRGRLGCEKAFSCPGSILDCEIAGPFRVTKVALRGDQLVLGLARLLAGFLGRGLGGPQSGILGPFEGRDESLGFPRSLPFRGDGLLLGLGVLIASGGVAARFSRVGDMP